MSPTRTPIAGLPIQKEWTVVAVREGAVEPNPNGGELQKFYVDFEGAPDVYWRRKLPATVEVGKTYFGTVSEGKHGPMFKKESPAQGGGSRASGSSSGGSRDYKPESKFDPEKVARIGRSHAQGMALQMLALASPIAEERNLIEWIDWFEKDVNSAATNAAPTAGSTETTPAPAAQEPEPQDHEYVLKLCGDAGVSGAGAGKLANFILERLNPEQQLRARRGLENYESVGDTIGQLRVAYEQAEGEPLPMDDPDDDIPF